MIVGIGIDVVAIARIRRLLAHTRRRNPPRSRHVWYVTDTTSPSRLIMLRATPSANPSPLMPARSKRLVNCETDSAPMEMLKAREMQSARNAIQTPIQKPSLDRPNPPQMISGSPSRNGLMMMSESSMAHMRQLASIDRALPWPVRAHSRISAPSQGSRSAGNSATISSVHPRNAR